MVGYRLSAFIRSCIIIYSPPPNTPMLVFMHSPPLSPCPRALDHSISGQMFSGSLALLQQGLLEETLWSRTELKLSGVRDHRPMEVSTEGQLHHPAGTSVTRMVRAGGHRAARRTSPVYPKAPHPCPTHCQRRPAHCQSRKWQRMAAPAQAHTYPGPAGRL